MSKVINKLVFVLIAVAMVVSFIPAPGLQDVFAEERGAALSGHALDGLKVRIRPADSYAPLSINKDGYETQNCVHIFNQGRSSQFYLEKADDDSYVIYFYTHYRDAAPKTSGDCRLDIDNGGSSSEYYKEGQVIHVVSGNEDAMNKRWQFIPQEDGTYYIRNKLSEQYWSLNDLDKPSAYNNKLVQRKTPMKWQIEIVSSDNEKLKSVNDYDSRNFTYNGQTVKSTNWMGALPGTLKISDISIPGTHDSGSCNLHDKQDDMSTQRYYIDELLNCGVRHLDLRTGLDDNNTVRIVHSSCHARNRSNQDLTLNETIGWIYGFLDSNPTETVILQVKMDTGGDTCERETFRKLEALAKETNSRIWAGDHVPTLDEVRGKILIISRLDPDKLQGGNYNIEKDGKTLQWALDCHDWKDSKDFATALTAQGSNYEVWTQDNWNRSASHKKSYIRATLFGNKNDGYTNGTMYRYDRAKEVGKDAWVFNYTSANNGSSENPFNISKEIHQWIYNSSDYSSSDRLVCNDTFTGVMAFDYMDGLMATKIYRTNFNRQYITIHGVTADGEEPAEPLTLFVGGESESVTKLQSDTTRASIRAHFNTDPYLVMAAENGEILSALKAANQEEFNEGVQAFTDDLAQGSVAGDLYVHLEAPIRNVEYEVEMPVCNTAVTAENPKVTVFIDDRESYEPARSEAGNTMAFITENADSDSAFAGTVEGGADMPVQIYLAPKWGYRFSDICAVGSDTTSVESKELTQSGQLKIKASARILHSVNYVKEIPATCTEDGTKEHYYCDTCNKAFFAMEETGDPIQEEASEEDLRIPAIGHDWGEWEVVKEASDSEEGSMIRRCKRDGCDEQESAVIPVRTHVHDCTHVLAKAAEKCTETGNIEYWVCDKGDSPCGCFYSDEACENQITEEETRTSAGAHNWGEPEYTQVWSGSRLLVTASRKCMNDPSHTETEMAYGTVEYHAPTCTEDGYQHVSVSFENEAFQNYEIEDISYAAPGHEWGEGKVVLEPTCSTTGIRESSCKRCGETRTEELPEDPDAHITFTEEDETSNTATCTEGGRQTQYEVCSLCDTLVKTRRITTQPLGHNWGEAVYKWSEDMSEATAARTCTRTGCGKEESETVKTTNRIVEKGSCETAGKIKYDAQFENESFETQEKVAEVKAHGHDWGEWTVTKEATETAAGEKQRVCRRDPSHIEKQTIPAKGHASGTDPNQEGTDGTKVGPGASAACAEAAILGMENDNDPAGSVYNKLKLKSTKQAKTSITLSWKKPANAAKFVLYGNKCGKSNKMKKLETCTGSSVKLSKVAGQKIKKGTYYKFILVALDANNNVVSTSKVIHVASKGGKVTNPKKVTVKKDEKAVSKVKVKKGKTVSVKNSVTKASKKLKLKKHRKVKYESANNKIATVTSKGKIKGIKKGTCYIYAYAQNGVAKKIKVTVN